MHTVLLNTCYTHSTLMEGTDYIHILEDSHRVSHWVDPARTNVYLCPTFEEAKG